MSEPPKKDKEASAGEEPEDEPYSLERVSREMPFYMPYLWGDRPEDWFELLESKFEEYNVTDEWMKFLQAVLSLSMHSMMHIPDLAKSKPNPDAYKELKMSVIRKCREPGLHKAPKSDDESDDEPEPPAEVNTDVEVIDDDERDRPGPSRSKRSVRGTVNEVEGITHGVTPGDTENHKGKSSKKNRKKGDKKKGEGDGAKPIAGPSSFEPVAGPSGEPSMRSRGASHKSEDSATDGEDDTGNQFTQVPEPESVASTSSAQSPDPATLELICQNARIIFDAVIETTKNDMDKNVKDEASTGKIGEYYEFLHYFGNPTPEVSRFIDERVREIFAADYSPKPNKTNDAKQESSVNAKGSTSKPKEKEEEADVDFELDDDDLIDDLDDDLDEEAEDEVDEEEKEKDEEKGAEKEEQKEKDEEKADNEEEEKVTDGKKVNGDESDNEKDAVCGDEKCVKNRSEEQEPEFVEERVEGAHLQIHTQAHFSFELL